MQPRLVELGHGVDKEACRGPKVVDRGGVEWGVAVHRVVAGVDKRSLLDTPGLRSWIGSGCF